MINQKMDTCLPRDMPEGRQENNNEYTIIPEFEVISPFSNDIPERLLLDDVSALPLVNYDEQTSTGRSSTEQETRHDRNSVQSEQTSISQHEDAQDPREDTPEPTTISLLGASNAETGPVHQNSVKTSLAWKEKLGTFALIGLIAGSVLLCVAVGTLMFIWFGNSTMSAWKEITARNWLPKAVSICIGVIQQAILLQLGIAMAMIASLALESGDVAIGDVASVSTMRATGAGTGAFVMAWQYLSRGSTCCVRHSRTFVLVISAALIWCLSQFLLIILLTGMSLRSTPGVASTVTLPYNLHYNATNSSNSLFSRFIEPPAGAWLRRTAAYTPFAEYSEPPYEAPGVSDTGVTLRAFLPFGTTRDREVLESYRGNATVLDARVTCQVPQIEKALVNSDGLLQGLVKATRYTPRLANVTRSSEVVYSNDSWGTYDSRNESVEFNCLAPVWNDTTNQDWKISLCQLWEDSGEIAGGLVSEFRALSQWMTNEGDSTAYGTAYLFLNVTLGTAQDWASASGDEGFSATPSHAPSSIQERGEWLDMVFSEGTIMLSVSICYAAFDFADVDVSISSQTNRTESRLDPKFDQNTSTYTFEGLRSAMGQNEDVPLEKRGILKLEKQAWLGAPQDNSAAGHRSSEWYLRSTADLAFHDKYGPSRGNIGNVAGVLCSLEPRSHCNFPSTPCVSPEQMHIWLLQEIFKTGGTIAFALQTMITVLSSMAYYEQMGQFDKWTLADLSSFETAEVPVGYTGLAVVLATVTAHGILVSYCLSLFLRKTKLTRLGASWIAIAQVATGDVRGLLTHATKSSDDEFKERLKTDGITLSEARLQEADGKASVSIVEEYKEKR